MALSFHAALIVAALLVPFRGRAAAPPATVQVSVTQLPDQDEYYIHGVFESDSGPEQVWKVLSDFNDLAGVLSGLRSSKIVSQDAHGLLLAQVLEGQFLFFHKSIQLLLDVQEQPPWRIEFTQHGDKPFRHYQGAWQIEPLNQGCRVDYTLTVSRGDMAPVFLEQRLFRDNSRGLMGELRAEVIRRAAQAPVAVATKPQGGGF